MKNVFRYAVTIGLFLFAIQLITMIGVKGFASWIIGFWVLTLIMTVDSLIRFLISEKKKKRFGK